MDDCTNCEFKGDCGLSTEDVEQLELDAEWVVNKFSKAVEATIQQTIDKASTGLDGVGLLALVMATFTLGAHEYRDFMIENGIDVLKVEGRV